MVDVWSALQLRFQVASYLIILITKHFVFHVDCRHLLTETEKYVGEERDVLFLLVL